jgi:hypothetical protein
MRRNDQPYERIYSPREMRSLLREHGLRVDAERAASYLPMLRIPGISPLVAAVDRLDTALQRLPATPLGYEYLFACRRA